MIRFILYAIIFYFIFRLLSNMFRPQNATSGRGDSANRRGNNPRQKVTVQYDKQKAKSKVAEDVGEYVDFEEVKD